MKMAREFTGADKPRKEMIIILNDFIKLQDKKINQIFNSSIKNYYEEIRNIMDKSQFSNSREYWKPLKRKNDSNVKIRMVKNEDGDIILDEKEFAEIQAKNYKKKFAKKPDIR
jgi:hypothetical protein